MDKSSKISVDAWTTDNTKPCLHLVTCSSHSEEQVKHRASNERIASTVETHCFHSERMGAGPREIPWHYSEWRKLKHGSYAELEFSVKVSEQQLAMSSSTESETESEPAGLRAEPLLHTAARRDWVLSCGIVSVYLSLEMHRWTKNDKLETREMVEWVRASAALSEDLDLTPSIHMV